MQYYPAAAVPAPEPAASAQYWRGATKAQIDAENAAIARDTGAAEPHRMVPYKASNDQQFWCRELDGSYTLRTATDIMEGAQPGYWQRGESGYPYFIREKK